MVFFDPAANGGELQCFGAELCLAGWETAFENGEFGKGEIGIRIETFLLAPFLRAEVTDFCVDSLYRRDMRGVPVDMFDRQRMLVPAASEFTRTTRAGP
jgi:hypothetical protein